MTNIAYVAAARVPDSCRVAEYAQPHSDHIPKSLLNAKLDKVLASTHISNNKRLTIIDKDVGHIHYEADPAFLFILITTSNYPQRNAFQLLSEARNSFEKLHHHQTSDATTSSLSKVARPLFVALVDKYERPENFDKIINVEQKVDQVKGMMQTNIEAALKNTDNLETLLDISDNMKNEASSFNRSSANLKKRMEWKNLIMKIVIVVLLLAVVGCTIGSAIIRSQGRVSAREQVPKKKR